MDTGRMSNTAKIHYFFANGHQHQTDYLLSENDELYTFVYLHKSTIIVQMCSSHKIIPKSNELNYNFPNPTMTSRTRL